jgi:ribosomal protein L32E
MRNIFFKERNKLRKDKPNIHKFWHFFSRILQIWRKPNRNTSFQKENCCREIQPKIKGLETNSEICTVWPH